MSDRVDGRFELETRLGRGSFGEAWAARDRASGAPVVVKLLRASLAERPDVVERFRREVRALRALVHPRIVKLVADGTCAARGQPYYAMERARGDSLEKHVGKEPFPGPRVRRLAAQLFEAIAAMHARGVIHRDLKPANLVLEDAGRPDESLRVIDFGIAKLLRGGPATLEDLTQGQAVGTPSYVAPEQIEGEASAPADVYAAGCILMELLTGAPPFVGGYVPRILERHRHEPAPRVDARRPGVAPDLVALVADCLEKDPARRPSPRDALAALLGTTETIDSGGGPALRFLLRSPDGSRRVVVFTGPRVRVGRSGSKDGVDLVLRAFPRPGEASEATDERSLRVSGRHVELVVEPGGASVTDLGSKHGTTLDGRALRANEREPLRERFLLEVGGVRLDGSVLLDAEGRVGALRLERKDDGRELSYVVLAVTAAGTATLGSGEGCAIRIEGLRPAHAHVSFSGGSLAIAPHDGPVAGMRQGLLDPGLFAVLRPGDELDMGGVRLVACEGEDADMKP